MKNVTITESKGMFFCDFYLCQNRSNFEIGVTGAPTGDRFRVCKDHYLAMRKEMGVQKDEVKKVQAEKEEVKKVKEEVLEVTAKEEMRDELKLLKQEMYKRGNKNLFAE